MSILLSAPAFVSSKSYTEDMIFTQRRLPFQTACSAGYRIQVLEKQCTTYLDTLLYVFNEIPFLKY
jgi:hypothetical protein